MAKYISKLITGEELYYLKDSEARANLIDKSEKGVAGGIATLDNTGKIPSDLIPDDIIEGELPDWNQTDSTAGDYIKNKPASLPASDVSSWAKASTKPSYAYPEIGYTVNAISSSGGSVSLAGTTPLHVVTLTGNVSALTLSSNPAAGHSCHVIFTSTAERTVAIAHNATNRVCPGAKDVSLTVPANGYVEIDFLSANNKIYVRGV